VAASLSNILARLAAATTTRLLKHYSRREEVDRYPRVDTKSRYTELSQEFDNLRHTSTNIPPHLAMESTMQQRRDEILAKKAKLAELKRQRELRKAETANRQSSASPLGEVRQLPQIHQHILTITLGPRTNTQTQRRPRTKNRRPQPHQQSSCGEQTRFHTTGLTSRRRTSNTT
jgi:hypothetical protein